MPSNRSLKNRIVCITGGTGLIGQRLVMGFVRSGAIVFVGTRFPQKQRAVSKQVKFLKLDITDAQSIRRFVAAVLRERKKIDVWVNSAWPRLEKASGPVDEVDPDIVSREITRHLAGYYRCCVEVLKCMKRERGGSIINLGSIYGDLSPDFRIYKKTEIASPPAYPLIKGGIHTFTKYLACYAAPFNIRVNAVCPGGVLNGHSPRFQKQYGSRVPLGRMARPEEIVGPVLFLASGEASYITGHLLHVDGGLHAW